MISDASGKQAHMAPLEKSECHLLFNKDSKEVEETGHSSMMTPPATLQTVADANLNILYTAVLFSHVYKPLPDSNFYH